MIIQHALTYQIIHYPGKYRYGSIFSITQFLVLPRRHRKLVYNYTVAFMVKFCLTDVQHNNYVYQNSSHPVIDASHLFFGSQMRLIVRVYANTDRRLLCQLLEHKNHSSLDWMLYINSTYGEKIFDAFCTLRRNPEKTLFKLQYTT